MTKTFVRTGLVILMAGAFILPASVSAARFYFAPGSGTYASGENFQVQLLMDTESQVVNAAEATISFPAQFLRVESLSSTGSVFKFWSQEPSYSNTSGSVSLGGGSPSPGISSSAAKVVTITFRAIGGGQAALRVENGAILANDGLGTNVLRGSSEAAYTVSLAGRQVEREEPVQSSTESVPSRPAIRSSTHPDQDAWYSRGEAEFSWSIPPETTGVSYALMSSAAYVLPSTNKGISSETSYDLSKFEDGALYFFLKFRNANGWGEQSRYKVRIDRTPPTPFSITRRQSGDPTDPQPVFHWEAEDKLSGITGYELKIGDGDWFGAGGIRTEEGYKLPIQGPGAHDLSVRAMDGAGNSTEAHTSFTVEPLPTPRILEYSKKVSSKGGLIVRGEARRGDEIRIYLRRSDSVVSFVSKADINGRWIAEYSDIIPPGSWMLEAEAADNRGALSGRTERFPVKVEGWLTKTLPIMTGWGIIAILAVLFAALLVALVLYLIHRIRMWRVLLRKDLVRLKEELRDDLEELEQDLRPLTRSEKVDLGPGTMRRSREKLKKEVEHLEKDVAEEIRHLDRLTG